MYDSELKKLKSYVPVDLWNMLSDLGCFIAGGSIVSMFTNREVADIDVCFPNKEAFTKAMKEVFRENRYGPDSEYDLSLSDGVVNIVTKKAVMLLCEGQQVQFNACHLFETPEEFFDTFDFTVCMGALEMKTDTWKFHPDFFKHNAQRYLHFNPKTTYPLVSAFRVGKYREKGFTISKAQYMKICLAINAKNISDWPTLVDELGGMYGTPAEEIFDLTREFDLQYAMEQLDKVQITEKMLVKQPISMKEIVETIPHAFTDEFKEELNNKAAVAKTVWPW